MELSERCIAQLEKEVFDVIYEEKLASNAIFPTPKATTTLFITEGSLLVQTDITRELLPGERYRYHPDVSLLQAGPHGCQLVIGQMNS